MPSNTPPPTVSECVTEVLHGIQVADPYRWLEEQDSGRTRKWMAQQAEHTRRYLDALPGRMPLRRRVEEFLAVPSCRSVWKAGNRCFFLKREAHQEQPVLVMREGESDEDIVLIDPAEMSGSRSAAIAIRATSPQGKLLAFSVRTSGQDLAPIGFFDVDRRRLLDDSLAPGISGGLVLSEEPRGFYYVHREIDSPRPSYQAVLWHTLGTSFGEDAEIFFLDERPNLQLTIASTRGARVFLYRAISLDPLSSDFYLHDIDDGALPKKILENIQGVFSPFFVGDQLFAFTDFQAPNCRIVAIDLDCPDPANWRTVINEREWPMVQFAVAGGLFCTVYVENLSNRILTFDLTGKFCGEVATPMEGTVRLCWQPGPTDTLFYEYSSFAHPRVTFQYRPGAKPRQLAAASHAPIGSSSIDVKRIRYPAKDGTLIPMFLVSKKNAGTNGPRPVFLIAYGGFATSLTPRFTAYATVLMDMGCVFAVANVRGGGELGKEWYEAAKRRNRQTAIDDFLHAAQWLITEGIADPARIAIGGGSNAGLLVGAALTQRPDLFRAVLCLGPLLDMLRYHKFDRASRWIDEFGSADDPDDFRALHSYSPYHRVRNNVAYPAVMFVSGNADTRCNPMHARKMTARLQAANASGRPILLDCKPSWGHVPVQPLSARVDALTDRLFFIAQELDITIPETWS